MKRFLLLPIVILSLAACSGEPNKLRLMRSKDKGPEEFSIAPNKALEMPSDFAALPKPGGENISFINGKSQAIAALGGNPNISTSQSNNQALIDYASRNGRDTDIRATLEEEDKALRRSRARFTKFQLFRTDLYARVYRFMALDSYAELERARKAGIQVPIAPPKVR